MKHIVYYLIIFLVSFQTLSQKKDSTAPNNWLKNTNPTVLSADVYASYGSTNIQNEFVNNILFGGYIDSTIKNKALSKLKNNNRFGAEFNYELKYYQLKDTFIKQLPNFSYYFGFGSYTNLSATYSKDLFTTAFYGNKQYEGETAYFNKTNLFQSDFKKLSFGIYNREKGISLALSVVSGNQHQLINFDEASLYTSSGGGQLDLFLNGNIQQSDSVANGYLSFSGIGTAVDFSFRVLKKVQVQVTNLGFASWKRNPSQTSINDTITFNGLAVDNIFSPTQLDVNQEIDSLLPPSKSESFTSILPAIIEISSVIDTDKKLQPYYGVRYKINSNYFPLFYAGAFYNISNKLKSSAVVSYGGYNNFEASLNAYYATNKVYIGIGTHNLLGSFRKNGLGRSVSLSTMLMF